MKLDTNNYFSAEAGKAYMSASQYKAFQKCEAAALAQINGEYTPPVSGALLIGGYVDAYFSGQLSSYVADHPELMKKDGSLKKEYAQAVICIERLKKEPWIMEQFQGAGKQIVSTGLIAGVPFKGMCDFLLPDRIIDLKCMRGFDDGYDKEDMLYAPWWQYWGYDIQGAIYTALFGGNRTFSIIAVSKAASPDITALELGTPDDSVLHNAMVEIEYYAPRYQAIKAGNIKPDSCGTCPYCLAKKHITEWERVYA